MLKNVLDLNVSNLSGILLIFSLILASRQSQIAGADSPNLFTADNSTLSKYLSRMRYRYWKQGKYVYLFWHLFNHFSLLPILFFRLSFKNFSSFSKPLLPIPFKSNHFVSSFFPFQCSLPCLKNLLISRDHFSTYNKQRKVCVLIFTVKQFIESK